MLVPVQKGSRQARKSRAKHPVATLGGLKFAPAVAPQPAKPVENQDAVPVDSSPNPDAERLQ